MEDTYKYNSVTVAKYIVAYANENKFGINMTKLQKLLYITYGVYMAVKEARLTNEHPQAWPYGPVFPTTRNRLLKVDFDSITMESDELNEIKSDDEMQSLVNLVFGTYGKWNGSQLSEWSHQAGSPWDRTVNSKGFDWGHQIPDEYIIEYFKNKIVKSDA